MKYFQCGGAREVVPKSKSEGVCESSRDGKRRQAGEAVSRREAAQKSNGPAVPDADPAALEALGGELKESAKLMTVVSRKSASNASVFPVAGHEVGCRAIPKEFCPKVLANFQSENEVAGWPNQVEQMWWRVEEK